MRISINNRGLDDGGVLAPIDPPPISEIDDVFDLVRLDASPQTFVPFEDVVISWQIVPKSDDVRFEDYVFSLVATEGTVIGELEEASDSAVLNPHQNTLIRIRGRRRTLSRGVTTLGRGLALTADASDCISREVPSSIFDDGVELRVTGLTSSTAALRLRDEIVSDWSDRRIRYRLPLELVLNNFFNGDVDITLEIRFTVHHDGDDSELEVTISHDSDANFHFLEDVLSLGSSAIVAKTVRKMLPLLLDCITSKMEEAIVRQLVAFIEPLLATHRLLRVDVVSARNLSRLSLVLCPLSDGQSSAGTAPIGGGDVIG